MDEEDNKVQDFINVLYLRHQLCCQTEEEMIRKIKGDDHFSAFLDTALSLVTLECGFMYFTSEFADKINAVMNSRRFTTKDKNDSEKINEIIRLINGLNCTEIPLKSVYALNYKFYQEELRETTFKTNNNFLESLGYDYVVFYALEYDMVDEIDKENYCLVLPSLLFLLKECPEIFQDGDVLDNTRRLLTKIKDSKVLKGKRKKKVKAIDELLKGITKKEE